MKTRFSRNGCFSCRRCGKRSRDVEDNGSVQLCMVCYLRNEIENLDSDYGQGGKFLTLAMDCGSVDDLLRIRDEALNESA